MQRRIDAYDGFAERYARDVAWRERDGVERDPLGILPELLDLLGEISGLTALDAGCGEGYLARVLAARGARVTGVDISPRLIALARERDQAGTIDYRVADLCRPLEAFKGHFDVAASYLVLNDVYDHRGFASTLGAALKPGGRLAIALNNPYSFVIRKHVRDYFDTGTPRSYRGMAALGLDVHFYHRTLEEYLDAFLSAGLRLERLVDLSTFVNNDHAAPIDTLLLEGYRFPYFMLLGFEKP